MLIKSGNTNLNRVLVLALDGFPHSLLMKRLRIRPASTWHQLLDEGSIYSIRSSRPEVSSVAWACYLTGVNPGEHGLFGFVDRTLNPLKLYFPNGASIRVPTILEKVDEAGGTVVSINFPATFPPKPLRGLIVGGFLGVRLETNVQPLSWLEKLNRHRYVIDADTSEAYHDREKFYNQLTTILESRFTAALEACREFDWTLFQLHLMETDRLFHFFWGDKEYEERFNALLDRVDEIVETFSGIARKKDASFVVLSDHGFTRAKRIFFINAFLRENGYLEFDRNSTPGLSSIDPRSRAYALPPARIFLNL
ncbi:MAG: alkaline phosphatase family protein, partial [Candidatus Electryonea clarkiae]|nr:alkaline phosphatase family protein [Candidatus Electryonea clarkiae]